MKITKFKYKGIEYSTWSLEEFLNKKKIPREEIQIIEEPVERVQMDDRPKYCFKNKCTGETIVSIYDNLYNLKQIINIEDWK